MISAPIISEQLKTDWESVESGQLSREKYTERYEALIDGYRIQWTEALLFREFATLGESAIRELSEYLGEPDLEQIRRRCTHALDEFKSEWEQTVDPEQDESIAEFYDRNESYVYELIWWHTLCYDLSPLAYVTALHVALRHGCSTSLDFGAGVGSGALLFAKHGLDAAIADISTPLLGFSTWRFQTRGLPLNAFDLKHGTLPRGRFDFITAMDVFEHLTDPVGAVDNLARALAPNGILFGRFHVDEDDDRGQHIVRDFRPTFDRLRELGFEQIWEDDWLWGHQAFRRKTAGAGS